MTTLPVNNPSVPFLGYIPGGLRPGLQLRITGYMLPVGDRIQINIQCGPRTEPLDDTLLHLSVRPLEHCIVRNTFESYSWRAEERSGGCPIRPGQSYDILIAVEQSYYRVSINGVYFCDFNHRMSVSRAFYVNISGATMLNYVGLSGSTYYNTFPQSTPPVIIQAPPPPPPPPVYNVVVQNRRPLFGLPSIQIGFPHRSHHGPHFGHRGHHGHHKHWPHH